MKHLALSVIAALLVAGFAGCNSNRAATTNDTPPTTESTPTGESQSSQVFTGEIMDSACAAMGSHHQMMKQEGAKDAKDCTLKCMAAGSKLVLYDAANKTTYELEDQTVAKSFAGQKVKVTGTYDSNTRTLHVQEIGPS